MQSVTQFFCVHNIDVKRDKVGMTTKEPESNERWTMSVPFTMGQELTIQSVNSVNSNRKLQTACYANWKMQNRKNWKEKELYRRHISLGVLGHDVMLILPFQEHNSRNREFDIGQLTMSIVQNSKNWRLAIHELYNGTYISLAPLQLTGAICLLRFRWEMPLKRDSEEDVAH